MALSWFAIARSVDEGQRGHFEKLQYEAIPFAVDEFSRACLPGWEKASFGFDGPKWNLTRSFVSSTKRVNVCTRLRKYCATIARADCSSRTCRELNGRQRGSPEIQQLQSR